ncbi:MAG: OmpA family protein [Helicobacter sp.]|nr:OmpA family protein [Helicobacter sp.]
MKKYLLLGSIAMALLATGCEVTEGAGANTTETTQPVQGAVDPSQFNTLEERIAYLQDKLQHIRFDYDKFDIRSDMVDVLNANTEILKNEASDLDVRLEGNTDEWGSGSYNFALGTKRAVAVRDALRRNGIRTKQVHSYGETNPICSEKTQECWEQNRRVEFKLLPKK